MGENPPEQAKKAICGGNITRRDELEQAWEGRNSPEEAKKANCGGNITRRDELEQDWDGRKPPGASQKSDLQGNFPAKTHGEVLSDLSRITCLTKNPHKLGYGSFCGHIIGLKNPLF